MEQRAFAEEAYRLYRFLKQNRSKDVLMPVRSDTKSPMFAHKLKQWNWNIFKSRTSNLIKTGQSFGLAILVRSLLVLDFDDLHIAYAWEIRFPILTVVPMETTKHGRHYFLGRTSLCDDLALFDKAGAFADADTHTLIDKVDLKTVSKTGTSGVVVVAPSQNKQWVRSLLDTEIIDIPDEMTHQLADMYQARLHRQSGKKSVRCLESSLTAQVPKTLNIKAYQDTVGLLEKIGFTSIKIVAKTEMGFNFDANRNAQEQRQNCPLCGNIHENNHWWAIQKEDKIVVKNYSPLCTPKVIPKNAELDRFYNLNIDPAHFDVQVYNHYRVLPFATDRRVTVEWATYGAGKTTAAKNVLGDISRALDKKLEDLHVVILCPRIAFALEKQREFSDAVGLNFDIYKDLVENKQKFDGVKRLLIEMESLWRLLDSPAPDVLLVDEFEAVRDLFSCETMLNNEPRLCGTVYEKFVKESRYVFFMDAGVTNAGLTHISALLQEEKALLRINEFVKFDRVAHFIREKSIRESEERSISLVVDMLHARQRVVCPVGTFKFGTELLEQVQKEIGLDSEEFRYYHGAMDDCLRRELENVEKYWKGRRLLMYTGVITVGNSCSALDAYDVVVVQGSAAYGPKARDMVQMMHRVRNLTTPNVYVVIDNSLYGKRYDTTWAGIQQDRRLAIDLTRKLVDSPDDVLPCPKWYAITHKMNVWEDRLSKQHFSDIMKLYLERTGYKITQFDDTSAVVEEDLLGCCAAMFDHCGEQVNAVGQCHYHDIPVVSYGEFQGMRKKVFAFKATKLMKDIVRRYEFDNVFGSLCDDGVTVGKVFDQTTSNKSLQSILRNKLNEVYKTPQAVCKNVFEKSYYLELESPEGIHLELIQQLLAILGLKSTHDTETIVVYQRFVDRQADLRTVLDKLSSTMGLLRDTSEIYKVKPEKKQDPIVKLARTVGREIKAFGGLEFKSRRVQKQVKGVSLVTFDYKITREKRDDVTDILRLFDVL